MAIPVNKKEIKTLLNQVKASANRRGIPFELKTTDLDEIGFPITCPVLGMTLEFHQGKLEDNSYSIDRIDSNVGYTLENIVIVSYRANMLKNNATLEELEKIYKFYRDLQK